MGFKYGQPVFVGNSTKLFLIADAEEDKNGYIEIYDPSTKKYKWVDAGKVHTR